MRAGQNRDTIEGIRQRGGAGGVGADPIAAHDVVSGVRISDRDSVETVAAEHIAGPTVLPATLSMMMPLALAAAIARRVEADMAGLDLVPAAAEQADASTAVAIDQQARTVLDPPARGSIHRRHRPALAVAPLISTKGAPE